ncbi:MAG: YajQ family cyclic di-GMP-binding protein [Arenicellales bacterium WSBS_2016_MAG_OTU3]
MPSFDVVSEIDWPEVTNAVDQANREIGNRFDFKGSDTKVVLADKSLTLHAEDEFKLSQALDILKLRLSKRGVDLGALEIGEPEGATTGRAKQNINIRHGIDQTTAKDLVKRIKAAKLKVQAAVQSDQVRVTGKKRDDLQAAIALLKAVDMGLPLQFTNFRD